MAGEMIRTASVYKVLRLMSRQAKKYDTLADSWKKEFGENDEMRRYELVRAESYRNAILEMVEQLDLDINQLWPDFSI